MRKEVTSSDMDDAKTLATENIEGIGARHELPTPRSVLDEWCFTADVATEQPPHDPL